MEGYDAKFCPPLEKRLECPICLLAQRDPMQTPCGHRFCAVCIQRALRETGPRCPVDNSRVLSSQLFHDNFAKREVLSLRVSCHGDDEGCNWKGELRELEFHSQQCQFILIDCPNGCMYKCNRKQMTHHVTECPNKLLPCLTCSLCFSATRLEEHNINCSKIKLSQSVLHNLEQNGETVQWCGMLHWMVMGREIQTNCFLAVYNNRNHSHLITSGWKNFIKVYPFVHPNIKSFLHQLRLSSGDMTPLSFYFLTQDPASNQFLQQLKRHACSGVGFVDRGSTSGHNVMFFTWNDGRKKIAAFTVELRGPKLKELLNYLRRTKDTAHHRSMIQRTDRAGYAQGSSSTNPMQQNGPHHPHHPRQLPPVSGSFPPPLLPSSQQPQGAGLQPYSSTSGILPDLLSWHMSQSLQPWSIQAAAPTGSFFTFPATPPQFIPSNTYSSPYTFAPFPAIASHFPIGTLPALSTVPTAINLPYTGVAAVPQVPQVPNYVGAIRSSMGEAPADVQPHEQPAGDISVIPITRDIFLVGAHHNNSASVNYSSNSNNREEVALVSNRRSNTVEQFHHQQQDVPSPSNSSPERSDLSSPSSLASILMNSPSPLSTSPSIPVLSPSQSRTPTPPNSATVGNSSSRYCPESNANNNLSPVTDDDNSSQPGPSRRVTDHPTPTHGTRNSSVMLQRHRNPANHQASSQLPQQHSDTQESSNYHDQVMDNSTRQQAAVLASPLHTLATAAVIVEQNSLAANPRDHQLVGTVMPTRQILSQQIPHIVAMGNMAAAAAAVAHNTNNNQNSSAARAPPTSLNADQTSMIYNYGHFVDGRAQNEALVDSPVNFGLGSPSFVHNIFAWPTVAAAPPPGMQGGQPLQNEIPDDIRQRSMWNTMMQPTTDGRSNEQAGTTL